MNLDTQTTKVLHDKLNENIIDAAWVGKTGDIALVIRRFYGLYAKDLYRIVNSSSQYSKHDIQIETVHGLVWSNDGKEFYYVPQDAEVNRVVKVTLLDKSRRN